MSSFLVPPRFYVSEVTEKLTERIDWGLKRLGIPEIWNSTMGKNIKVCVLDTGIETKHIDLHSAIADAHDFTQSASGPEDRNGHGTHIAGVIAARSNGTGVKGVAPESKLLIGKVLNENNVGTVDQLIAGLRWGIDQNADIISMSLGTYEKNPRLKDVIVEAFNKGIILVAGAGNEGTRDFMRFPAQYSECIAVGSVDRNLARSRFSNGGPELDIMAPGEEVFSTYLNGLYAKLHGTSVAAPFVSGVCALILAKHRMSDSSTAINNSNDMREHLTKCATDVGSPGFDWESGHGLINPRKAFFGEEKKDIRTIKYHLECEMVERIYNTERNRGVQHVEALEMAMKVISTVAERATKITGEH